MTGDQEKPVQLRCPRCGGVMRNPAGSRLYWHADNYHPRCDITNIVETVLESPPTETPAPLPDPPKPRSRGGK